MVRLSGDTRHLQPTSRKVGQIHMNISYFLRLSPALAVLLTSCGGGDVTVKTDLNETFVVKKSAVTKKAYDWTTRLDRLESVLELTSDLQQTREDNYNRCASGSLGADQCAKIWLKNTSHLDLDSTEAELDLLKKYQGVKGAVKVVNYRPIFTDVNNDKKAMGYTKVTCLSSKVKGDDDTKLLKAMGFKLSNTFTPAMTSKAVHELGSEVCRQYAFSDTVAFGYDNSPS